MTVEERKSVRLPFPDREHAGERRVRSPLGLSADRRLIGAGAISLLLWLTVWWALA